MKRLLLILCCVVSFHSWSMAQMCPGGGIDFLTAVTFDPAWIYGCNTGTSCNGGVNFDNRTACLPITLLDACAPAPSCGTANNASNAWYKFFASSGTATISCFQNTSFVIGIQAFSGGPLCGSLTEIGCALAGGPSSGVQLNLSGLTPGQLYYFRIFGSATPVSQRTGLYCFCGTTGLSNFILPVGISEFTGKSSGNSIAINWNTNYETANSYFEVERAADGRHFATIARINGNGTSILPHTYTYADDNAMKGMNYYRLKQVGTDGKHNYSNVITVKSDVDKTISINADAGTRQLKITVTSNTRIAIYNAAGQIQQAAQLTPGVHFISTAPLVKGVYFLRTDNNVARKFYVY